MSADAYMLLMLKQLAARGSLFLIVRTHHHLGYYFNLNDTRGAANENGLVTSPVSPRPKVVEIHPISRVANTQRP